MLQTRENDYIGNSVNLDAHYCQRALPQRFDAETAIRQSACAALHENRDRP